MLGADEAGQDIEPSQRTVRVGGTTWFVFSGSGSQLPLACRTCRARTGGTLAVRYEDATYECAQGHLSRDPRLGAEALRQAIRTTADRTEHIAGDFYIPVSLAE